MDGIWECEQIGLLYHLRVGANLAPLPARAPTLDGTQR